MKRSVSSSCPSVCSALRWPASLLVLLALPGVASASREVESLRIIPEILGYLINRLFLVLVLTVLIVAIAALVLAMFRRSGRGSMGSMGRQRWPPSAPTSTLPPVDADSQEAEQRRARNRELVDSLVLRPSPGKVSPVDDDTRARIAAAAKRIEARTPPSPDPGHTSDDGSERPRDRGR